MSPPAPRFFFPFQTAEQRFTVKLAYIAIVGASLTTGYFAGRYLSSVKEHGGRTPSAASHNRAKATEPDGDDTESEGSSEAGDGDLAQVKPSLEEECKLVGCVQHSRLRRRRLNAYA